MLYILATPIGNKDDITLRALDILRNSDIILAEDSRVLRRLCNLHNIKPNKIIVYNDSNKTRVTEKIINLLKEEKQITLTSDAGTPGISDPGFYLVRECRKENIPVFPIPGPSALTTALSVSGLPTDRFTFYGFFPKKKSKQEEIIKLIKQRGETSILYESPHRINKTLILLKEKIPNFKIFIAREMTKKFEEYTFSKINDLKEVKAKGEFTIIISKA